MIVLSDMSKVFYFYCFHYGCDYSVHTSCLIRKHVNSLRINVIVIHIRFLVLIHYITNVTFHANFIISLVTNFSSRKISPASLTEFSSRNHTKSINHMIDKRKRIC